MKVTRTVQIGEKFLETLKNRHGINGYEEMLILTEKELNAEILPHMKTDIKYTITIESEE